MSSNGEHQEIARPSTRELKELCTSLVLCYGLVSSNYAPFANMRTQHIIHLFEIASRELLASANEDVRLAEKQCEALWPTWREELGLAPSAQWPSDFRALWGIVRRFTAPYEQRVALNAAAKRLVRTWMQLDQVQSYVESMRQVFGLR